MPGTTRNVMGTREWALLGGLSVLWGGSLFFGKVALAELRPFTLVLGRAALAAIALNLVVLVSGRRMPVSRLTPQRLGGMLAGIAGVAVMLGPDALRASAGTCSRNWP